MGLLDDHAKKPSGLLGGLLGQMRQQGGLLGGLADHLQQNAPLFGGKLQIFRAMERAEALRQSGAPARDVMRAYSSDAGTMDAALALAPMGVGLLGTIDDVARAGSIGARGANQMAGKMGGDAPFPKSAVSGPVNHATFTDFDEFDFSRLGSTTGGNAAQPAPRESSRLGAWFAERDVRAEMGAPINKQAHLNIERPLEISSEDLHAMLDDIIAEAGEDIISKRISNDLYSSGDEYGGDVAAELRRRLQEQGYDGLKVRDTEFDTTSWVAFDPSQVRMIR